MVKPLATRVIFSLLPNIDYKNAKLEDLLREVDSLELPEFESPIVLPPKDISSPQKVTPLPKAPIQNQELVNSEKLNKIPQNNNLAPEVDNYIVLGERIDQELRRRFAKQLCQPVWHPVEQETHL